MATPVLMATLKYSVPCSYVICLLAYLRIIRGGTTVLPSTAVFFTKLICTVHAAKSSVLPNTSTLKNVTTFRSHCRVIVNDIIIPRP